MSDKTDDRKKISPRQAVYNALQYCQNTGQAATRTRAAVIAGCSQSVCDEAIRLLMLEEKIKRVSRGCYALVEPYFESRAVSSTLLNTGAIKIEVGETLLELSLLEARHLGILLLGIATNSKEGFAR